MQAIARVLYLHGNEDLFAVTPSEMHDKSVEFLQFASVCYNSSSRTYLIGKYGSMSHLMLGKCSCQTEDFISLTLESGSLGFESFIINSMLFYKISIFFL